MGNCDVCSFIASNGIVISPAAGTFITLCRGNTVTESSRANLRLQKPLPPFTSLYWRYNEYNRQFVSTDFAKSYISLSQNNCTFAPGKARINFSLRPVPVLFHCTTNIMDTIPCLNKCFIRIYSPVGSGIWFSTTCSASAEDHVSLPAKFHQKYMPKLRNQSSNNHPKSCT